MKAITRKTRRLVIRPLEVKDYEVWKKAHLDMSKSLNTWDLGPRTPETLKKSDYKKILRAQAEKRKRDSFYDFGVFKKDGQLIGGVSLMEIVRAISQTCFLGYGIYNDHWGRGYAKEAVRAVIDIGFEDLKLHRIEAGIEPKNRRSLNLAKSLSMRREGLKKRALFVRNTWVDLAIYTLTCEDLGRKFNTKHLVSKK
jgi:ribosomal-protein-alanine N-acetyltransferase